MQRAHAALLSRNRSRNPKYLEDSSFLCHLLRFSTTFLGSKILEDKRDFTVDLIPRQNPKLCSQQEIRAWLDSLAQFSDKVPSLPEKITREWIYQDHD